MEALREDQHALHGDGHARRGGQRPPVPRRARLTPRRALLAAAAVGVAALIVVATTTSFRTQPESWLDVGRSVASWSSPCWTQSTAADGREYTLPCARVSGIVLYRQQDDPDGDGDRHALVAAGRHLVIVKVPRGSRDAALPAPGGHLTAVGFLDHGRFGLPVVETSHVNG